MVFPDVLTAWTISWILRQEITFLLMALMMVPKLSAECEGVVWGFMVYVVLIKAFAEQGRER